MNHSRASCERSANAGTLRKAAVSASTRALSAGSVIRLAAFPNSACTLAATVSLHFSQILMHELNDHRAFAYSGGHAFHRTVPHVAHHENSRNIRLQQSGIAIERPAFRSFSIFH